MENPARNDLHATQPRVKKQRPKTKTTHYFCNGKDSDHPDPKTAKIKRKAEKIGLPFVMVNGCC